MKSSTILVCLTMAVLIVSSQQVRRLEGKRNRDAAVARGLTRTQQLDNELPIIGGDDDDNSGDSTSEHLHTHRHTHTHTHT